MIQRYIKAIEIAAVIAAILAVLWGWHEIMEHERQIGRDEQIAANKAELARVKEQADRDTADMRAQRDKAIEERDKNVQTLRTLTVAAVGSSDRLRDTLTGIRDSVPTATVEALRATTSTLATVFADCQGRYRQMAASADGHAIDANAFDKAWPVVPASTK